MGATTIVSIEEVLYKQGGKVRRFVMHKRVVIVGSMTFHKEMQALKRVLVERGWTAFAPGDEAPGDYPINLKEKAARKVQYDVFTLYHREIDAGDVVLCYNAEKNGTPGYIGANALIELGYGAALKKRLYLLFQLPDVPYYREELLAMSVIPLHENLDNLV